MGNGYYIGVVPAAMVDMIEKYADRDSSVKFVREYYMDDSGMNRAEIVYKVYK
jgi:hypothetical protein